MTPEQRRLAAILLGLTACAAVATVLGAGMSMSALEMTGMARAPGWQAMGLGAGMRAMPSPAWSPAYAVAMFGMWWIMMLAMMLPTALPAILRYGAGGGTPAPTPYLFAAGYALAWGLFSLAATMLQWALEASGLLAPMMLTDVRWLAALFLLGAGAWQLAPQKLKHLTRCRLPWPHRSPLTDGLAYGLCCLSCCWALMLLLFYGGVMNLWWIGGLAVLVLAEQVLPRGQLIARVSGAILTVWGVALAAFFV